KGHDPIDEFAAAMPQLPQTAHRLHPAKHLFNQLALPLANRIAGMSRRPAVNGTVGLLCDMRGDFELAHLGHERGDVVVLVAGAGSASLRRKLFRLAHASSIVPSTVKCSSDIRSAERA